MRLPADPLQGKPGWPVLLVLWALNLQTTRHYVLVVWAY